MQAAADVDSDPESDTTTPLLGSRINSDTYYVETPLSQEIHSVLEPADVYRSRWRSIRVMYLVMFLGSVTFTITMSSLWPFLQVLNPSASTSFLGWVVAAYSMGQLVASPFFGLWSNQRNSSREPLAVSLVLTVLSNLFYTYLESISLHSDYFMILARGLIGFSAGNVAVVRSYVSGATTVEERTSSMANLSIFQAMGFILGPVIQAALVPLSYPGPINSIYFHFNMYTAPAFAAALVAVISVLLLIFVFKEHRMVDDDVKAILQSGLNSSESEEIQSKALNDSLKRLYYKLDYVAVFSSIFLFFIVLFMFTVFETIGTPLTMHMYAWSKSKATLYQGIILGVAGVLSILVFLLVKFLAKKYSERYLLLVGFIFCLCGYFTLVPWGKELPPLAYIPINQSSVAVSQSDAIFALSSYILSGDSEATFQTVSPRISAKDPGTQSGSYPLSRLKVNSIKDENLHNVRNNSNILSNQKLPNSIYLFSSRSFHPDIPSKTIKENVSTLNSRNIQKRFQDTLYYIPSHMSSVPLRIANTIETTTTSTSAPNGCPWEYSWCRHVPLIFLGQFLGATVLISIGYPVCNMLSYALYSKVLGPKPQGLWMGWLTAAGSLARTVGPIYVSQVYDSFGPQVTFGSCTGLIFITIIFYLVVFRRMVPFTLKENSLTQFGSSLRE